MKYSVTNPINEAIGTVIKKVNLLLYVVGGKFYVFERRQYPEIDMVT